MSYVEYAYLVWVLLSSAVVFVYGKIAYRLLLNGACMFRKRSRRIDVVFRLAMGLILVNFGSAAIRVFWLVWRMQNPTDVTWREHDWFIMACCIMIDIGLILHLYTGYAEDHDEYSKRYQKQ